MMQIPLTQGKFAIVDDEDFQYLNRFKWFSACNSHDDFVARRKIKTSNGADVYIEMGSLIIPPKQYSVIGHKNKDTLDYRKENLFYESYSVKRHRADKQRGKTTSKYKGVCWYKKNCPKDRHWSACIYIKENGVQKRIHLGYFADEKMAGLAYNKKARELYGDLAFQNDIDDIIVKSKP